LLAVNLGRLRYERCPGCKRFHMTHRLKESDRVLPASVYESFSGVWYRWLSTQKPVGDG
jgi:hypothetical protein